MTTAVRRVFLQQLAAAWQLHVLEDPARPVMLAPGMGDLVQDLGTAVGVHAWGRVLQ